MRAARERYPINRSGSLHFVDRYGNLLVGCRLGVPLVRVRRHKRRGDHTDVCRHGRSHPRRRDQARIRSVNGADEARHAPGSPPGGTRDEGGRRTRPRRAIRCCRREGLRSAFCGDQRPAIEDARSTLIGLSPARDERSSGARATNASDARTRPAPVWLDRRDHARARRADRWRRKHRSRSAFQRCGSSCPVSRGERI